MMDTDARHRDLLFLLGLAPLALGCSVGVPDDGPTFTSTPPSTPPGGGTAEDDGSEDDQEGGSAGGTSGSAEDGMSASVSVSVSVGDDGSTSGASASASMSASVSVSMGDDMGTYTYTSSYGPPPYGSSCDAYGYLIASCYYNGDPMMAAMVASNCEEGLSFYGMTYGPACGMAYEDMVACLSQLSCQQFETVGMPGAPCGAEDAAFGQACF